jgi:hypothetical protein
MATVPRYVGTTVAEAITYAQEQLEDDFLRVFDRDGDGTVVADSADGRAFARAVCAAETEIDEKLAMSHGAPFTGTIPSSVREIALLRSLWCAVRTRLTMSDTEKAPYRTLYKDTDARLTNLQRDNGARIPEKGVPEPTRSHGGVLEVSEAEDTSYWKSGRY